MSDKGLYGYKGTVPTFTTDNNYGLISTDEYIDIYKKDLLQTNPIPPISTQPTSVYIPSTFNNGTKVWEDYQGTANSSAYRGTPLLATGITPANGSSKISSYVYGSTTAGLRFGHTVCNSGYTGIHVARYTGTEARIFNSTTGNWLSGFWSGNAGVAFHEGWLTSQTDRAGTNWLISVDQYNYYAAYWTGNNSFTGTGGTNTNAGHWSINYGSNTEHSDWAVYGFWYWNTALSSSDISTCVTFIKGLTGIA